ncbi:hypothetical protein PGT21_001255 [Puccinia graminis f. sp. tritici]|uniref:Uncharacterized protein n=1 Tax=Puccinia graminis f. sp. tritici TaxID=56615 RepID=A0A5B0NV49_PUCGR|nr:hypothetical protein PGT21_001255 [Puccinia graminis f. sp. tritici]
MAHSSGASAHSVMAVSSQRDQGGRFKPLRGGCGYGGPLPQFFCPLMILESKIPAGNPRNPLLFNRLVSLDKNLASITAAPDKAGDLLVDTGQQTM